MAPNWERPQSSIRPRSSSVATADSDATPRIRAISGRETGCRYATIERHSACAWVSGGVRGFASRRRAAFSAAGIEASVQPPPISRRTMPPWRCWSCASVSSICAGSASVASARSAVFTGSGERNSNDSTMAARSGVRSGSVTLCSRPDGDGLDHVWCGVDGDSARWIGQRVRDDDRDRSERNLLLPYRLPLLLELQQRQERDRLRQAIAVLDRVVETEATAAAQQAAQVREALADRDTRTGDVRGIELRRGAQEPADRLGQHVRVVGRVRQL